MKWSLFTDYQCSACMHVIQQLNSIQSASIHTLTHVMWSQILYKSMLGAVKAPVANIRVDVCC